MNESRKKDWRELCAAVASESVPKKLGLLVEELIRALDERQRSFMWLRTSLLIRIGRLRSNNSLPAWGKIVQDTDECEYNDLLSKINLVGVMEKPDANTEPLTLRVSFQLHTSPQT